MQHDDPSIPYIQRISEALNYTVQNDKLEGQQKTARALAQIAHEAEILRAQLYEIFKAAADHDLAQIRHIFKMCDCHKKEPTTTTKSH